MNSDSKNSTNIPRLTRKTEDGTIEVAVLVSPGFGAGWSTWNREFSELLLFHKKFVELVSLGGATEECYNKLFADLTGDEYGYVGGCEDLVVEWVKEGTKFWVHEYDGSESLRRLESFDWATA